MRGIARAYAFLVRLFGNWLFKNSFTDPGNEGVNCMKEVEKAGLPDLVVELDAQDCVHALYLTCLGICC